MAMRIQKISLLQMNRSFEVIRNWVYGSTVIDMILLTSFKIKIHLF